MAEKLSQLLRQRIEAELPNLRALSDERASTRRGDGQWSAKEELGHLTDSAANNHIRFVAGAIGPEFRGPNYAQNEWVRLHGYRDMPWAAIVARTTQTQQTGCGATRGRFCFQPSCSNPC